MHATRLWAEINFQKLASESADTLNHKHGGRVTLVSLSLRLADRIERDAALTITVIFFVVFIVIVAATDSEIKLIVLVRKLLFGIIVAIEPFVVTIFVFTLVVALESFPVVSNLKLVIRVDKSLQLGNEACGLSTFQVGEKRMHRLSLWRHNCTALYTWHAHRLGNC